MLSIDPPPEACGATGPKTSEHFRRSGTLPPRNGAPGACEFYNIGYLLAKGYKYLF
jgi:hypothetical protein